MDLVRLLSGGAAEVADRQREAAPHHHDRDDQAGVEPGDEAIVDVGELLLRLAEAADLAVRGLQLAGQVGVVDAQLLDAGQRGVHLEHLALERQDLWWPRLRVGVYASAAKTAMIFRQIVGRFVRTLPDSEGVADLYLVDLQSETVRQLTNDRYTDMQGTWSPDGRVLAFDLDTGQRLQVHDAPASPASVLGDLAIAPDGQVWVSDAVAGALYRVDPEAGTMEPFLPPQTLISPQGLCFFGPSHQLVLADYSIGLVRVDTETGALTVLETPDDATLLGIDGLACHGEHLLAVQNGVAPQRVLAITLDDTASQVRQTQVLIANHPLFDEPTLGTVVGEAFYFVANSHWNRFDDEGRLPPDLELSGPLLPTEVQAALGQADVFVQHSVTAPDGNTEGWPVSIAEAAATGLPIVSTRHAGIPTQVVHGETGYLVNEHDMAGMADWMAVLATNPSLRIAMGTRSRAHIQRHGNLRWSIKALRDFISEKA